MIIALSGPSCVGKSHVARRLARHLGWPVVSTGDVARHLVTTGEWKMPTGHLFPDEEPLWAEVGRRIGLEPNVVIDGAPRLPSQPRRMATLGCGEVRVIFLTVGVATYRARSSLRGTGFDAFELARWRDQQREIEKEMPFGSWSVIDTNLLDLLLPEAE